MTDKKPKIFILCNSCSSGWHIANAITEDGCFIAEHVCSDHGFIKVDMGVTTDNKHEIYKRHYPNGYEIIFESDNKNLSPEIKEAFKIHLEMGEEEYKKRMQNHKDHDDMTSGFVLEFSKEDNKDA